MASRPWKVALLALTLVALCSLWSSLSVLGYEPPAKPVTPPFSARVARAAAVDSCLDRLSDNASAYPCLQQALWGKCALSFMRGCDASCGRCVSDARRQLLRRTLLVSARQPHACAGGAAVDAWVGRAMQNHAEYARIHGMPFTFSSALIDSSYEGAWNKLAYLQAILRAELNRTSGGGSTADNSPASPREWILWADWDVVFTDLASEIPLEEYERRNIRLVLGGDPAAVNGGQPSVNGGAARADYLKANTGVLLLRVHRWSLALITRMLARGGRTRAARRAHALQVQEHVANLCVGCIDDQATLLELLQTEPHRWATHTVLERRYLLQGHWEDFADAMPLAMPPHLDAPLATPLRRVGAAALPPLRRSVFGLSSVPLSVHFAGCQLCSGKSPETAARCWPAFRRTVRFAEEQSMRPLGLRHARANRSAADDLPLEPLLPAS